MTRRQIAFILGMLGFLLVFCMMDTTSDTVSIIPIVVAQGIGLGCFIIAISLGGRYER